MATGSFPAARFGMALVGLGLGLSIPATNVMVAQRHPGRRGAALSHLNLMWGAGAVLSPLLFMALPPWARVEGVLLPLAAIAGLTAIGLAVLLPADPPRVVAGEGMGAGVSGGLLALSAAQLLLAVGTETAVGGWIVAVYPAGGPVPALLVGGGFWAAFLAGRAVAPVLLRRWSESALHAGALALAGLGARGRVVGRLGDRRRRRRAARRPGPGSRVPAGRRDADGPHRNEPIAPRGLGVRGVRAGRRDFALAHRPRR